MPFTTQTANYAHELAFEHFGGITRRILYDQDRVFVTDENLGDILLTEEFMQFTDSHPFEAVFCRKADPESKGKVENVVKYVKNNFLKGRIFSDIDSLQADALAWLDRTGNAKVHGTTKKVPAQQWQIEKTYLLPYDNTPEKPFIKLPEYTVRKDNTILFRSNYYSLPLDTYKGPRTKVLLETKAGKLFLYAKDNQLLATHTISSDTGKTIRNTDHARAKSKSLQQTHELVLHGLGNTNKASAYLAQLEQNKPRYYHDNLKVIQKSIDTASSGTITKTLLFCAENNVFNGYHFADVVKHYQKEEIQNNIPVHIDTTSIKGEIKKQGITPQTSNVDIYESIIK